MSTLFDFSFDPGKAVALIPTLMSVVGSVNIARLVKRSPSFQGSAKQLLMGMSICEIVSAVAFSAQSLFINRETSHFLWAIGNGSALGLMMQFSISSYCYSIMMSFIYLSKVRFGANRDFVEKRIEPWTGALGFGYPLITALIGAAMRVYSQMEFLPPGTDEATVQRQRELSAKIGQFLFPGYPITFLIAAVAVNSLVIFAFVRAGRSSMGKNNNDLLASQTNGVATAAVLLTYVWTAILRVLESNDIRSNNKEGLFPLVLLQAVFLPALGIFNLATWVQPRFQRVQTLYPFESWTWCVRRALFGEHVKPTTGCQQEQEQPLLQQRRVVDHDFSFSSSRRCNF